MVGGYPDRGRGSAAAPAQQDAASPERYTNRLSQERSPYLLQHAHNPVDWRPWGTEAFDQARSEDKPIFLSIGYSTCHWCHVMERESFEDPHVARLINEYFVPIKVDREERPDVDRVYMTYVQAATGSGGWPLSVFLTPGLQPFLGGTYFPPEGRYGMPGLKDLLLKVHEAWLRDRPRLLESAGEMVTALRESLAVSAQGPSAPGEATAARAYEQFRSRFDARHPGFGHAPKFPQPVVINFLLRHWARTGEERAREMALQTLRAMAEGGIHDQLGGGFHRYSTDERWFLPHFEKMLYDQGLLASAYLDAYQVTGDEFFSATARDILDYVLREMTGPEGQFYSAQDADSAIDPQRPREKAEGRFYVWTAEEVEQAVGRGPAGLVAYRYGIAPRGNVLEDPHGEFIGRSVLYAAHDVDETARRFGLSAAQARIELAAARHKLLEARNARPAPGLDDKTLVAWNGLMISALARSGAALGEARYLDAAARGADLLRRKLYDPATGTLYRRLRQTEVKVEAFLDDYAFYIQGLIDLYETTLDIAWLRLAAELQSRQDALFWDEQAGGYFATTGRDDSILLRAKDSADGAEPAGNSVAALNLLRLAHMTGDERLATKARRTLQLFAGTMRRHPEAMPQMLCALDFQSQEPLEVVLAGRAEDPLTRALLREVHAHYIPNKIVLLANGGEGQRFLSERGKGEKTRGERTGGEHSVGEKTEDGRTPDGRIEFLRAARPIAGRPAAYVCRHFICHAPVTDAAGLRKLLLEPHASSTPP